MEILDSRFHGNDKIIYYLRKNWIPVFTGMTKEKEWILVFPAPRFHEDRFREDWNGKIEILDSRFHGNDNKHLHSCGSRNLYYQLKNWIPVFTGMT